MAYKRKCANCGKTVYKTKQQVTNYQRSFCDNKCSVEYRKRKPKKTNTPNAVCLQCGKEHYRKPARLKLPRHFCSAICVSAWRVSNNVLDRVVCTCEECGKVYKVIPSKAKWTRYCSLECKQGTVTTSCAQCGKDVNRSRKQFERAEKHFCDIGCRAAWQSDNLIREDHPNWKGGWNHYYGHNWKRQRAKARARDKHQCQHCGITRERLGKALDVHHITPFREYGYIPDENENYREANHLGNLITLCPSCHHRAEWGKIPLQPRLFI